MWIMTADGWRQLHPKIIFEAPKDDGRYRGPLPSFETIAFLKRLNDNIQAEREGRLQRHNVEE